MGTQQPPPVSAYQPPAQPTAAQVDVGLSLSKTGNSIAPVLRRVWPLAAVHVALLLIGLLPFLIWIYGDAAFEVAGSSSDFSSPSFDLAGIAATVTFVVFLLIDCFVINLLLIAAMRATGQHLEGQIVAPISVLLKNSTGLAFRAFLLWAIAVPCILLGFVFCLAPGALLATFWILSLPILFIERRGVFESLGKSWSTVRTNLGSFFLVWLVFIGLYTATSMAMGVVSVLPIVGWFVQVAVSGPIWITVGIVLMVIYLQAIGRITKAPPSYPGSGSASYGNPPGQNAPGYSPSGYQPMPQQVPPYPVQPPQGPAGQ